MWLGIHPGCHPGARFPSSRSHSWMVFAGILRSQSASRYFTSTAKIWAERWLLRSSCLIQLGWFKCIPFLTSIAKLSDPIHDRCQCFARRLADLFAFRADILQALVCVGWVAVSFSDKWPIPRHRSGSPYSFSTSGKWNANCFGGNYAIPFNSTAAERIEMTPFRRPAIWVNAADKLLDSFAYLSSALHSNQGSDASN